MTKKKPGKYSGNAGNKSGASKYAPGVHFELRDGLYIADDRRCKPGDHKLAVVHACKHHCHMNAVGQVEDGHPNYLGLETDYDLILNMIDSDKPIDNLGSKYLLEIFARFLTFARKHRTERKLLIHCNRGESRAPSLALLHMAKNLGEIPSGSFDEASRAFSGIYPGYAPKTAIRMCLAARWTEIS